MEICERVKIGFLISFSKVTGTSHPPHIPDNNNFTRGVGYMDVVEALLLCRNATKIFWQFFNLEKIFHTSKY
jgi:hypothetical protein